MDDEVIEVIQFTDTHYFANASGRLMGVDTEASFEATVELSKQKHGKADIYLLTGDLSQDETPESYERLWASAASLQGACYFLPGNHDDVELFNRALAKNKANIKTDRSLFVGNWQIILLNTVVASELYGHLADSELQFLKDELAKSAGRNIMICLHHHPIPVGSSWIDAQGLRNAADFFEIVDPYDSLKAVLFGHVHQEFESIRNGVSIFGCPSTCVQFAPNTNKFAVSKLGPGYRFLKLYSDGRIETKVERLANVPAGLQMTNIGY